MSSINFYEHFYFSNFRLHGCPGCQIMPALVQEFMYSALTFYNLVASGQKVHGPLCLDFILAWFGNKNPFQKRGSNEPLEPGYYNTM